MKILILQCCDENIKEYSKFSIPHNIKYALKYNYDFQLYQDNNFKHHPAWLKIDCFKNINYKNYDYIWVLDADALINNFDIKLENIIDGNCIIVSENGGNGGRLINSGSIIYSKYVIQDILNKYFEWIENNNIFMKRYFWEQELINDFYEENSNIFTILNMYILNSGWKDMPKENFVYHFMGRDLKDKVIDIKKYVDGFDIY